MFLHSDEVFIFSIIENGQKGLRCDAIHLLGAKCLGATHACTPRSPVPGSSRGGWSDPGVESFQLEQNTWRSHRTRSSAELATKADLAGAVTAFEAGNLVGGLSVLYRHRKSCDRVWQGVALHRRNSGVPHTLGC